MRRAGTGRWYDSPWFWWVMALIVLIVVGMVLWVYFGRRTAPYPAVPTTGSAGRHPVAAICRQEAMG